MTWSLKKLQAFYKKPLGAYIKKILQTEIRSALTKRGSVDQGYGCIFGFDIMDGEFPSWDSLEKRQQVDFIISYHCEETGHPFQDLIECCNNHLRDDGLCILLTPNGNGFWSNKGTPFCKYRSYKNIKALKRKHFKILEKRPVLCFPMDLHKTTFCNTHKFWDFLFRYCAPNKSGAFLVTAQKTYELVDALANQGQNQESLNLRFQNSSS